MLSRPRIHKVVLEAKAFGSRQVSISPLTSGSESEQVENFPKPIKLDTIVLGMKKAN